MTTALELLAAARRHLAICDYCCAVSHQRWLDCPGLETYIAAQRDRDTIKRAYVRLGWAEEQRGAELANTEGRA